MKITVVGCGLMGSALINAFMNAGHELSIVDINKDAADKFVERGASYYQILDDALDSDFILLNLPNHEIVKSTIEGIAPEKLKGTDFVNTTTSSPNEVEEIDGIIKSCGGRHLDAKIECYPQEVGPEAGFLVYSGDKKMYSDIQDALSALAKDSLFLSESVAMASVTDLSVAIDLHCAIFYSLLEGTALTLKHDCPVDKYFEMVEMIMPAILAVAKRQITDTFEKGIPFVYEDSKEASIDIEYHALCNAVEALEECGATPIISKPMQVVMKEFIENGNGKKDFAALMTLITDQV